MADKYKVTEFLGDGDPVVVVACRKADWVEMVKAADRLAAREAELQENIVKLKEQLVAELIHDNEEVLQLQSQLAARDARIAVLEAALSKIQDYLNDCHDEYEPLAMAYVECYEALSGKESNHAESS